MKWDTGIEVLMILHVIIGVSFVIIASCVLHGVLTSSHPFFRYVGIVFASFIGICGISRLAHGICYAMALHRLLLPTTALEIVVMLDSIDAMVGMAAAVANVWVVVYFWRHPVA